MGELYIEESFRKWKEITYTGEGNWPLRGWRLFNVGGALGRFELIRSSENGIFLRITRENAAGDSALDQGNKDLRYFIRPGEEVFARVWARRSGGQADLNIRMAEYEGMTWSGKDNEQVFELTDQFRPYLCRVLTSKGTSEMNLAIRVKGIGSLDVQRVEVGPVDKPGEARPVIELPQGRTVCSEPVLWWRGPVGKACQVRLAEDPDFKNLIWDSQPVETSRQSFQLPALEKNIPVYAAVRVESFDGQWSEWSEPTVIVYEPLGQAGPGPLVVYDLRPTRKLSPAEAFEQAHLVSVLQGIVNRKGPRLFLLWRSTDEYWLEKLRQPGRFLEKLSLEPVNDMENLLEYFSDEFEGVVLWDTEVAATSNVASTVAGVRNLLPVPFRNEPGSLYRKLVTNGPKLPVIKSLVDKFDSFGTIPDIDEPSSGSRKNDAYRWAIVRYLSDNHEGSPDNPLKPIPCNPRRMGYYMDAFWIRDPEPGLDWSNHCLSNHDFFIMHKGFFWDLNVWPDEKAVDDPSQPAGCDYETLLRMLHTAAGRLGPDEMIHCGGFTPWAFKYNEFANAGGGHHPVHTEWETVRILSAFNAYLDADALHEAGMANASVYAHLPRPVRANQPPPPLRQECIRKGWMNEEGELAPLNFLIHYVGDYDAASWLTVRGPDFWEDFRRGQLILPWAWSPVLVERGGAMFDEFIRSRTPRDILWAGDNGAGYVNPTQLLPPRDPAGLPPAGDRWIRHNRQYFRTYDYRHTGFIINGLAGAMTPEARKLYESFSGDGIVEQDEFHPIEPHLEKHLPVLPMMTIGLDEDIQKSIDEMGRHKSPGQTRFITVRSVLRYPDYYRTVNRGTRRQHPDMNLCDLGPADFFYLLRYALGGKNELRAAFLYDSFPDRIEPRQVVQGKIWLRNIGWDTWKTSGQEAVRVAVEMVPEDFREKPMLYDLPHEVKPGQLVEIDTGVAAPDQTGRFYLRIDLVRGETGWFSEHGNLPECRLVFVQ
jgi:hypothetical protein